MRAGSAEIQAESSVTALASELHTLRSWHAAPRVGWGERMSQKPPALWLKKHAKDVDPVVRSDSLLVQIAAVGVTLIPEPSAQHYGLVPLKLAPALRADAEQWPTSDLYLVTHRALRDVPRVRVVWELLLEHTARATGSRPGDRARGRQAP